MTKYVKKEDRVWESASIVGNDMKRCILRREEGSEFSAYIIPMPKGLNSSLHRHETWVIVFVLEGKIRVLPDNKLIEAGDFYYVEEGDEHEEIGEEESLVLIIKQEPNVQYPINSDGERINNPGL